MGLFCQKTRAMHVQKPEILGIWASFARFSPAFSQVAFFHILKFSFSNMHSACFFTKWVPFRTQPQKCSPFDESQDVPETHFTL
jgi:hypothetical protein